MEKQKWINEGGVYFPIPGYATIYTSPGNGVFQIKEDNFQHRLGLARIADSFEFDFKLYDLGCEDIFERGLCLPSDNKMQPDVQDKVISVIRKCFE